MSAKCTAAIVFNFSPGDLAPRSICHRAIGQPPHRLERPGPTTPVLALGLPTALHTPTEQLRDQCGRPCHFAASGPEPLLADEVCLNLFLICQEALQNITKHAKASAASMQLACDATELVLKISDNGSGMAEPVPTGFGMRQMLARANAIGAHLTLRPNLPTGTVLQLILPTDAKQAK